MTRHCSRSPVRRTVYHSYSGDDYKPIDEPIDEPVDEPVDGSTTDVFCKFLTVFCLLGMVRWVGIVIEINFQYLRVLGTLLEFVSIAAVCMRPHGNLVWSTGLISTVAVLKTY